MKRKKEDMSKEELVHTLDLLYTAAGAIHDRDAMKAFLRDLLTESERIMLGRRIWIARLLLSGTPALGIAERLTVSLKTIYKVERWLKDQFEGYERAITGLEKEMDKRAVRRESFAEPFSYAALKRKYPLHFLFFPDPKPKKKYKN